MQKKTGKYRFNLELPKVTEVALVRLTKTMGTSRTEAIRQVIALGSAITRKKGKSVNVTLEDGIFVIHENRPQ